MDHKAGSGAVRCAWRWCVAMLLGGSIAIACADNDALTDIGNGGRCPAPCSSNPTAQGGRSFGGSTGNGAGGASEGGLSGSSFGDAAGMSGASAPSPGAECEDDNPCTVDERAGSECRHVGVSDGTPCNDQNLCTTEDACHAGLCTGSVRSNTLRVLGTAYAFGGALLQGSAEVSHGLVAFLSPNTVLFADALGSNTLLTLGEVDSGVLRVIAQSVTDRSLVWQPFNAWVWQTVPLSHLVPLANDRFAFVSLQGMQVFQATADGKLVELWRTHETVELSRDVAQSGDVIWTCPTSGRVTRYALASDSSLRAVDTPELASAPSCNRLAVAPDGSVYAAATEGVMRWAGEAGHPIAPELILPGVQALELTVDETHIALQRAARLGAFGDTEVYRKADLGRVALFSPNASDVVVGLALVSGKLLLEWRHASSDLTRVTGALYDLPALGPTPVPNNEWLLRSRPSGNDPWAANISRLAVAGKRVALQPWRRVAEVDAKAATAHWLTGPGHGEIAGLKADPSGGAQTFSSYSLASLVGSSYTAFGTGGMSLPADVQRLELVLPEQSSASNAIEPRTRAVQLTAVETVTALRRGRSGLEVAGAFDLAGGPAKLIQRGGKLYQIAAVGDAAYRIRVFDLGALGQSPLVPVRDVTLSVPASAQQGELRAFEADVDQARGEVAVSELRTIDAQTNRYALVWASFDQTATILGQGPADSISPPLLHAGRLLQIDRSRVTLFSTEDGHLQPVWTQEAASGESFVQALDVDDAARAYLTTNDGHSLMALDWADGARLSSVGIPEVVTASAISGDHLLIAGTHSLSTLDPACIESTSPPDAGTDASDTDSGSDAAPAPCGVVPACPDGGLVRSTLKGDATGDGCVDSSDTQLVTACLAQPVGDVCKLSYVADLDGNGTVNTKDYLLALQNQGKGCNAGK